MRKLCLWFIALSLLQVSPLFGTCEPASGSLTAAGNVVAELHDTPTLTLGEESVSLSASVRLVSSVEPSLDGHAATIAFEFADGDDAFELVVPMRLTAAPGATVYSISGSAEPTNTRGAFAGATGTLTIEGTFDTSAPRLEAELSGSLCRD
jgi:hypothetical protein